MSSWDRTPWMIGGGAIHTQEVARLMAYAATSGAEGIIGPGELKVTELPVPSTSIRVSPGACLVRNGSTVGRSETYVARLPVEDRVEISPTGSGAGRSDLIIVRIEDPFEPGTSWAEPADPTTAQYVYTRVIPNVPAGTLDHRQLPGFANESAITIARVDMPAATGTVIQDYITDLRSLAAPRTERKMMTIYPNGHYWNGTAHKLPTSGVYSSWPIRSEERPIIWTPEWATKLDVVVHISGAYYVHSGETSAESVAGVRTGFGAEGSQNGILIAGATGRGHYVVAGSHGVSDARRGSYQTLNVQAVRSAGAGNWWADYQTSVVIDYQFSEATV